MINSAQLILVFTVINIFVDIELVHISELLLLLYFNIISVIKVCNGLKKSLFFNVYFFYLLMFNIFYVTILGLI